MKRLFAFPRAVPSIKGRPRVKCSMTAPRMAGFRCFQSPSRLVTEMKSEPKNTRLTSGMANSALARGERPARLGAGEIGHRAFAHHLAAGKEFQGGGIGGGFGLDEHGWAFRCSPLDEPWRRPHQGKPAIYFHPGIY